MTLTLMTTTMTIVLWRVIWWHWRWWRRWWLCCDAWFDDNDNDNDDDDDCVVTRDLMTMTLITTMMMTMLVTLCYAVSLKRDTPDSSDVKRSPWFYQQPPQLSHDTGSRHLAPGRDQLQVYRCAASPNWLRTTCSVNVTVDSVAVISLQSLTLMILSWPRNGCRCTETHDQKMLDLKRTIEEAGCKIQDRKMRNRFHSLNVVCWETQKNIMSIILLH